MGAHMSVWGEGFWQWDSRNAIGEGADLPCPDPAEKRNRKNGPCVYRVLSAVIEVLNKKLFVANAECNGQGFYFIGIEMALTDLDFG